MSVVIGDDDSSSDSTDIKARLNVADPKRLFRRTDDDGAVEYLLEDRDVIVGAAGSGVDESNAAAQVPLVMVLENFPRSFLQIRKEVQPILQTPVAVDSATEEESTSTVARAARLRRKMLQQITGSAEELPVFSVIEATVNALAHCGNNICEFGEAVGTWAYTDFWNCASDCPFDLFGCPHQVCNLLCVFDRMAYSLCVTCHHILGCAGARASG